MGKVYVRYEICLKEETICRKILEDVGKRDQAEKRLC